MKCLIPRRASNLLQAALLVWLAALPLTDSAWAETETPNLLPFPSQTDKVIQFSLSQTDDSFGGPDPRGPYVDDPAMADEASPRADLYTLTKLAVDELEFLAGIRLVWDRTEKRFDRWARKLKLKGDIAIGGSATPAVDGDMYRQRFSRGEPANRTRASRTSLSLRSIFIPEKIRWKMGFDPTDRVAFGALQWGPYLALQGDIGGHQEVRMVFQCPF